MAGRRPPTADEANRQTLADCRLHDFERVGEAGNWRCRACKGVVTTADQYWYRTGLHDGIQSERRREANPPILPKKSNVDD